MKRRRGPWTFEVRIVPPETYPDLQVNPQNSYTEYSEEERLESCIQGLADALVEGQKAKKKQELS